ncbi:hypothetical protein V7S43_001905 [Phytophthora oleae]|uniref:FAR1 domain-containing protein n=1 Tax=Phytophthora oleae TaxID=2107226 RepID=A0ABD3G3N3_9STRA
MSKFTNIRLPVCVKVLRVTNIYYFSFFFELCLQYVQSQMHACGAAMTEAKQVEDATRTLHASQRGAGVKPRGQRHSSTMEQQNKKHKKHKQKKAAKKARKRRRYESDEESSCSAYDVKSKHKANNKKTHAKNKATSTSRLTLRTDEHECESTENVPPTQPTILPSGEIIQQPIRNQIPSVDGLEFASWDAFDTYWNRYQVENLVSHRCRDSATRENYNSRHLNNQITQGFRYAFKKYACKLGCRQKPRGAGKRTALSDRFRGCVAKIRAVVRPSAEVSGKWVVIVTGATQHFSSEEAVKEYTNS